MSSSSPGKNFLSNELVWERGLNPGVNRGGAGILVLGIIEGGNGGGAKGTGGAGRGGYIERELYAGGIIVGGGMDAISGPWPPEVELFRRSPCIQRC